jgi:hypothetical protein
MSHANITLVDMDMELHGRAIFVENVSFNVLPFANIDFKLIP